MDAPRKDLRIPVPLSIEYRHHTMSVRRVKTDDPQKRRKFALSRGDSWSFVSGNALRRRPDAMAMAENYDTGLNFTRTKLLADETAPVPRQTTPRKSGVAEFVS